MAVKITNLEKDNAEMSSCLRAIKKINGGKNEAIDALCEKEWDKMTPKQFAEFLEYVKANNSWGEKMYEVCIERNRVAIKYIETYTRVLNLSEA